MPSITLEQALFLRPDGSAPRLVARSPGFADAWLHDAEALALGFGDRPSAAFRCPALTVFAKLLTGKHVAIVRVRDDHVDPSSPHVGQGEPGSFSTGLRFHFLVVDKNTYETWIRDPFHLASKVEAVWDAGQPPQPRPLSPEGERGEMPLPTISLTTDAFVPRTVADTQAVLKRVKAAALREGEDPEAPDFERTIENSESPVLLGGAQILVDGGRLVFERPQGDLAMVSALWLLLPEATRVRLWPTSFAFSRELEFDVLVLPHVDATGLDGYTSEEQAADYPQGAYELALQRAAEAGNQKDLDAVFQRRDGWQTIKLGLVLLALLSLIVLASRWLEPNATHQPLPNSLPARLQPAVGAAGIVGVGEFWPSVSMMAGWHKLKHDAENAREHER